MCGEKAVFSSLVSPGTCALSLVASLLCSIPDLSLSNAHWRWGLHSSTHWASESSETQTPSWSPTRQTWAGFVCTLLFVATTGSLELFRKSGKASRFEMSPSRYSWDRVQRLGCSLLCSDGPKTGSRSCLSPSGLECHISLETPNKIWVCSTALNQRTQPENSRSCWGFKKSDSKKATYYCFEIWLKKPSASKISVIIC